MKIYDQDPWLEPWKDEIEKRSAMIAAALPRFCSSKVNNHIYYPLHIEDSQWVIREWAPNATKIYLLGDFNNWKRTALYAFEPVGQGNWELKIPRMFLSHGSLYKLWIEWPAGGAERLPAYVTRVVQDPETKVFCAQVWDPAVKYEWKHKAPKTPSNPFIYECHIGMSSEKEEISSFDDFRKTVLPRVRRLGYNVIQIMALQEHPYYGSFGYQVSNFFALSSRFGTPEEFKRLVDEAHGMGISVIMDMVQSHSVSNEAEGLSRFDGREDLYFYQGPAGYHPAWGTRCFDYGKDEVKYFLLSNCKYWLEEYRLDGFRFDGVTSMLYWNHGLNVDFGDYSHYFGPWVDSNAVTYLALACKLVHDIRPGAIVIAEDVSAMPGLAAALEDGGIGFDFRMSMGVADNWIKWIKELPDEKWNVSQMWYELTVKRVEEKTVSYAECHDQALVGDKTIMFRLADKEMYWGMEKSKPNLRIDRAVALHKMIRLATAATAGNAYLTFMGNEFGHPEWIDFPREGNGWSFKYARRQWSLADNPLLRFCHLEAFDREMVAFLKENSILSAPPQSIFIDEWKQVLVFRRQNAIFALNFNPVESFPDYGFKVPRKGTYEIVLNSDEKRFGGFGRLEQKERHETADDYTLRLYLPSRCALVLLCK